MQRDEAYLLDILIATHKVLKFVSGVNRNTFEKNELLQSAVIHPLEIMGEAAGLISENFREKHPEIPWHKMIGMRNRLIHEYFRVDYGVVWDTIQKDVPELVRLIEPLVPPDETK